MKKIILYFIFLFILATSLFAKTQTLPRFAALRSNAVNSHVGPGNNYPIEWKFVRQNLPIEITAEFDNWRRIRDYQGTSGWVHKSLLSGKRSLLVINSIQNMHASSDKDSGIVARLEPGVIVLAIEMQPNWCKVEFKSTNGRYKGWVLRQNLWGTYPDETSFK